jgi:hypothetical protein
MFVGNMTKKDWDRLGHFCKECDEAYTEPLLVKRTSASREWGVQRT